MTPLGSQVAIGEYYMVAVVISGPLPRNLRSMSVPKLGALVLLEAIWSSLESCGNEEVLVFY